MKQSKSALFTLVGILTICTTPVFTDAVAEETAPVEATKTVAATDCNMPEAFLNAENMANAVADPAKFMQLITLMSKPDTMQSLMNCTSDTEQLSTWTKNLLDPTFKMNAATVFMNPQVYMNWMTAMMNPQTFSATMNTFMNPALYTQWMTAMSNPAYYQSMFKVMDPKWQQSISSWMVNPMNYQASLDSTK